MKTQETKNAFHAAYLGISRENKKHVKVRDKIVKACGIGTHVFYFWLHGKTPVPFLAKPVISEIMNIPQNELFPDLENEDTQPEQKETVTEK